MSIFKSVNQENKILSFSDQSLERSCCGVAWRVRVKGQSGRFERRGVVLRAIDACSEKRDVCEY